MRVIPPTVLAIIVMLAAPACKRKPELGAGQLLERAVQARAKKDYTQAGADLRSAAKLDPNSARIRYELGLLYLDVGDLSTADYQFHEAIRINPKYPEARRKIEELSTLGPAPMEVDKPEVRDEEAFVFSQSDADAVAALALSQLVPDDSLELEQRLRDVLVLFPRHLGKEMVTASARLTDHDMRGVEQALRNAKESDPQSTAPVLALGIAYWMMDRLGDAEGEFGNALRLDPRSTDALDFLVHVRFQRGRLNEAEYAARQLAKTGDPKYADAYATFLFKRGRTAESIVAFQRVADANRKDRIARTRLIEAYLAARRFQEAEGIIGKALTKNRKDTEALLQRAEVYLVVGKYRPAQIDLNLAYSFRPDWAETHYVLARVSLNLGATQNQRRELNEALRLDPGMLPARVDLAGALIRASDARAALDLLSATPDRQKNRMSVIAQRNWALWALGEYAQLRGSLQKSWPSGTWPDFLLQDSLLRLREKDARGARAEVLDVLKENPGDKRARKVLARIEESEKKVSDVRANRFIH